MFLHVAVGATAQPAGVQLDTLTVKHIDFQGRTQEGIIICNHIIADDLRAIFEQLYKEKYPIERIRPISEYGDGTLLVQPETGKPYVDRKKLFRYKISRSDLCYRLFTRYGFRWGGDWRSLKDYQHFEK